MYLRRIPGTFATPLFGYLVVTIELQTKSSALTGTRTRLMHPAQGFSVKVVRVLPVPRATLRFPYA